MEFLELAQKRFSCRSFTDRPVEEEKLKKIMKAGILAPTAVNYQPWKAWVIQGDKLVKFREVSGIRFVTPVVILIGADESSAWVRKYDERNFADVDASIAATQMMLEVEDLGLGTVWVGHFNAPAVKKAYPQTKDYDLIGLFPIGYPAGEPSAKHIVRKSEEELFSVL